MSKDNIVHYSVIERLRDGREVLIRAIRRSDTGLMADALTRVSSESLYHRTFSARRNVSGKELAWLTEIDFERIVSLVVLMREAGQDMMVGEGRYVRTGNSPVPSAEVAFLVDDNHQGLGIGSFIFRHLAAIARDAGIMQFEAEVLPWNERMLRLFRSSGLPMKKNTTGCTVHVTVDLVTAVQDKAF